MLNSSPLLNDEVFKNFQALVCPHVTLRMQLQTRSDRFSHLNTSDLMLLLRSTEQVLPPRSSVETDVVFLSLMKELLCSSPAHSLSLSLSIVQIEPVIKHLAQVSEGRRRLFCCKDKKRSSLVKMCIWLKYNKCMKEWGRCPRQQSVVDRLCCTCNTWRRSRTKWTQ